jgi:hypothetical protein
MERVRTSRGDAVRARLLLLAALAAVSGPCPAKAAPLQYLTPRSVDVWSQEDACVAGSVRQFPDHDLASLQNRDRAVDACLAAKDLPPRAHLVPDP